jgi:hypothetical protein
VKKAIKLCVVTHKKIFRKKLATIAASSRDPRRKWAMRMLAGGLDTDLLAEPKARRIDVPPARFKEHFENLFSKVSEQQTLNLTEDRVGPKSEVRMDLAGPPTVFEVQFAISKLQKGSAPGSNGLRPEVFKAGGAVLAHRLAHDFRVIWPCPSHAPDSESRADTVGGEDPETSPRVSNSSDRAKVFQAWQDAEVVTIYKMKGARSDPNSYRGIFLLDVAGKVLATVLERRIKQAAEDYLDDGQNGFRERRSASHSIHVLRRVQEAVRVADLRTFAVFIDFEKAFDSPPRGALFEVLEWIGCPPDLLAMVAAIHEDPKGKIGGSAVWFRVARGIRQGCVLGPTMFITLLEFCIRMANLSDLGVEMVVLDKKVNSMPVAADLAGTRFRFIISLYADDVVLVGTSPKSLSAGLERIQAVCGKIGLNISVSKTEWIYLHHPESAVMEQCKSIRTPVHHCCDLITFKGLPLKHKSTFCYLGSTLSENGGVNEDTRTRVLKAELSLNKYDGVWKSELTLRQKIRFLKSHVLPTLVYGQECGNHTQRELSRIAVFLNVCRRKLLGVNRKDADGRTITNIELQRRCRLMTPLDLLSRRRVNFVAKVIARPSCEMARRMCFAEVVQPKGVKLKKVSGRERSSFLACLDMDLRYLYSGEARSQSLSQVIAMAYENGPPFAKMALKALKPDISRGDSFKLVSARTRDLICPVEGCTGRFAEQKEVNRHVRNTHSAPARPPIQVAEGADLSGDPSGPRSERVGSGGAGGRAQRRSPVTDVISIRKKSTETAALSCPVPTCSRVFKTPGWLARHIKSNHAVPADAANSDLPPAQMVGAAEPELPPQPSPAPMGRGRGMAGVDSGDGRGPVLVVGPGLRPRNRNPVPLIGDNEYGHLGRQSRRRRPGTQGDA